MSVTKASPVSLSASGVGVGYPIGVGAVYSGPWIDLTGSYAAQLSLEILNGSSAPTAGAVVQIQTANDYTGGTPTSTIVNYGGPLQAGIAAGLPYTWSIDLEGMALGAVRVAVSGVTGNPVTFQGDCCRVTGI